MNPDRAWASLAVLSAALVLPGCMVHRHHHRHAGPPAHAPAHGYRRHRHVYYYYPHAEVYLHVASGTYHWYADGRWHARARAPRHVRLERAGRVEVSLDTETPRKHHARIRAKHPPRREDLAAGGGKGESKGQGWGRGGRPK